MAVKKFQLPITVGVHDPALDTLPEYDANGRTTKAGSIGVRHMAPGEWVEIEEDEAERIFARFGRYDPTPKPKAPPSANPYAYGGRP